MDLSFALRRRLQTATTPDLHALLSAAAARQAVTPTARAHWQRTRAENIQNDSRIALFSGSAAPFGASSGRFADIAECAVNSRQLS